MGEISIISNMGVNMGMYKYITLMQMIAPSKGGSTKATYGPVISLDKTSSGITWEPTTSTASLALNGGVVRTNTTGVGTITMNVTAISEELLQILMIGITKDTESGALVYDFSNMSGNKFQINFADMFSEGYTRCYKFMNVRPSLPGATINANDPENTTLAANGTITLAPEAGSSSEGALITKDFKSDDVEGIFAFMTEPYPPKASQVNLTVASFSPTNGGSLNTNGIIKVTFSEGVTEGISSYIELMSASGSDTYEKIPDSDVEVKLNVDTKIIDIKHKTGFTGGDKVIINVMRGAQSAAGNILRQTAVATYTVSGL